MSALWTAPTDFAEFIERYPLLIPYWAAKRLKIRARSHPDVQDLTHDCYVYLLHPLPGRADRIAGFDAAKYGSTESRFRIYLFTILTRFMQRRWTDLQVRPLTSAETIDDVDHPLDFEMYVAPHSFHVAQHVDGFERWLQRCRPETAVELHKMTGDKLAYAHYARMRFCLQGLLGDYVAGRAAGDYPWLRNCKPRGPYGPHQPKEVAA